MTALVLWLDGRPGSDWPRRCTCPTGSRGEFRTTESIWTGDSLGVPVPIFVLFVGVPRGVAVWPSPKNLSHLIALSAAVLIGVQFWHADRGGVYVLWYLPLILLMVFRPNLTTAEPPEPGTGLMPVGRGRVATSPPGPPPPKELAV